jgi:predicted RNase H-like nuclease (RuvC/YqgF family)
MNPADISKIDTHGDPMLEFFKWAAVVVIIILIAAAPIMQYVRKFSADQAANKRDEAEGVLYQHMSERVNQQQAQLDEIYKMHNQLVQEHANATARLSKVEEYEATIEAMKRRLDEKDAKLDEKDSEVRKEREHNRALTLEIISLKNRISELEKRLLQDEEKFCRDCIHSTRVAS